MPNPLRRLFGGGTTSPAETSPPVRAPGDSLASLAEELRGKCHPEFPFLSKEYSPGSRIPCADFTTFIARRLAERDTGTVVRLMRAVIEANPGLGIGPEWMDEVIAEISATPFHVYVDFAEGRAYDELRAMFIICAKSGGGREFMISDEKPLFLAWTFACYRPRWKPAMSELVGRANKFIRGLRRDGIDFWRDYPLFTDDSYVIEPALEEQAAQVLQSLSPAARRLLFRFVDKSPGSITGSSTYAMRDLGIDLDEVANEILSLGLAVPMCSAEAVAQTWTKSELAVMCDQARVEFRKSWNKHRLAEALFAQIPDVLSEQCQARKVAAVSEDCRTLLEDAAKYAEQVAPAFGLLSFAR